MEKPKWGKGFVCTTPSNGSARIRNLTESVSGGCTNLSQEEYAAYKRAVLLCAPENGSQWESAKSLLEAAGFEVLIG